MGGFLPLVVLSTAMGLSIFLSYPIVARKRYTSRTLALFSAVAIGLLVFLLADVFADVASRIYDRPANGGYVADPWLASVFVVVFVACFLVLYGLENRERGEVATPVLTASIVALAVGFQNLTEGLVFGANWAAGTTGFVTVIFVGFFLQNVTEGFPIAAPLLASPRRPLGTVAALFLVGGIPTVIGASVGYFVTSSLLIVVSDTLALAAILYCLLPMFRAALRPAETPEATRVRVRILYVGTLIGFALGFLVNSI